MTKAGACVLLSISLAACGVGDDGGHGVVQDPNDALGVICDDPLILTGTFARGKVCSISETSCNAPADCPQGATETCAAVQPADHPSCWPIGVWTFSSHLSGTEACAAAPTLLPSYAFTITESLDGVGDPLQTGAYTTDPTTHAHVKVSDGGAGLCEGDFELFSPDGTQFFNFTPNLNADDTITGQGLYRLYTTDQWN
jgi:hypothetical protein